MTFASSSRLFALTAFMRNLRNGFYGLGGGGGNTRLPQSPRLVRAWDELTIGMATA
jgi:hypothetical protein